MLSCSLASCSTEFFLFLLTFLSCLFYFFSSSLGLQALLGKIVKFFSGLVKADCQHEEQQCWMVEAWSAERECECSTKRRKVCVCVRVCGEGVRGRRLERPGGCWTASRILLASECVCVCVFLHACVWFTAGDWKLPPELSLPLSSPSDPSLFLSLPLLFPLSLTSVRAAPVFFLLSF